MEQPQGQRPGHVPNGSLGLGSSRQTTGAGLDVLAQKGQLWGAVGSVRLSQAETAIYKALIMEKQTGYPGGEEQGLRQTGHPALSLTVPSSAKWCC